MIVLLMLALLSISIVPAMRVAAQMEITNVCLVTDLGKINDGTFNQFAYEGMAKAFEEFSLDSTYIETQNQADYAKNIGTCVDEGYQIIITVGFLIADATRAAAAENPDTYFIGVDQFVGPDANGNAAPSNYMGLQFREDQSGFLAGALAAQMSMTGTVAGVYGIDIPPVKKFRNGFEQGAKYINPDIKLLGTYIPSFIDPAAGGAAANQFLGEGADVIFGAGGPTGSGGIVEAAKKGVYVIGVDQDEFLTTFGNGEAEGADRIISSAVKRVDQGVYLGVKSLVEGGADFVGGGNFILSAANDGVGFAEKHDSAVPDEVTARMAEILAGLKAGTVWTGVDPVGGDLLPTVTEAATAAGAFSTLLSAVEAAGWTDTLVNGGPFTIFAPTDDAFAALPADQLQAALDDPQGLLTNLLTYHVVSGAYTSDMLVDMGMTAIPTVQGGEISLKMVDGMAYLNDTVSVTTADVLVRNGVIHVIDGVLMPPS
jgi:basic membrane lipoprotein Med (substrate-binding protein (PBP1-ABC) superfamily)